MRGRVRMAEADIVTCDGVTTLCQTLKSGLPRSQNCDLCVDCAVRLYDRRMS